MTLSFAEIDSQHPELLPARTVMSLFVAHMGNNGAGDGGNTNIAACGANIDAGVGLGLILAQGTGLVSQPHNCSNNF